MLHPKLAPLPTLPPPVDSYAQMEEEAEEEEEEKQLEEEFKSGWLINTARTYTGITYITVTAMDYTRAQC